MKINHIYAISARTEVAILFLAEYTSMLAYEKGQLSRNEKGVLLDILSRRKLIRIGNEGLAKVIFNN